MPTQPIRRCIRTPAQNSDLEKNPTLTRTNTLRRKRDPVLFSERETGFLNVNVTYPVAGDDNLDVRVSNSRRGTSAMTRLSHNMPVTAREGGIVSPHPIIMHCVQLRYICPHSEHCHVVPFHLGAGCDRMCCIEMARD